MEEVERFWLDIVRLTSTHSVSSETQVFERDWTFCFSHLAVVEGRDGLSGSPQTLCLYVGLSPVDDKVASLRLRVGKH